MVLFSQIVGIFNTKDLLPPGYHKATKHYLPMILFVSNGFMKQKTYRNVLWALPITYKTLMYINYQECSVKTWTGFWWLSESLASGHTHNTVWVSNQSICLLIIFKAILLVEFQEVLKHFNSILILNLFLAKFRNFQ